VKGGTARTELEQDVPPCRTLRPSRTWLLTACRMPNERSLRKKRGGNNLHGELQLAGLPQHPTSTARNVRSSSQSIRAPAQIRFLSPPQIDSLNVQGSHPVLTAGESIPAVGTGNGGLGGAGVTEADPAVSPGCICVLKTRMA
jgi:hypothetical protein